jgi:hypothetical protein
VQSVPRRPRRIVKKIYIRPKNPEGRPPTYQRRFCAIAKALIARGSTQWELADVLGVSEATVSVWKGEHPEFSKAIEGANDNADNKVVRGLYERAVGCSVPDTHFAVINDEVVATPTVKHYPPSPDAARFWLEQRRRKQWGKNVTQVDEDPMKQLAISLARELAQERARNEVKAIEVSSSVTRK